MFDSMWRIGEFLSLAGLLATAAPGRNPTLWLEVTAVNAISLATPASEITAARGDVLTAKIFVRDWSADGERLRALQATMDPFGYTSGSSGTVQPVDFDATSARGDENKKNGFIDVSDPAYLLAGLERIAVVDTVSYGYRYLNVSISRDDAPVSPQDGTKYYCGTVNLAVSDDAFGHFVLGLDEDPAGSALRDVENRLIVPLDFERLTVHVVSGAAPLRIVSSDPPSGAIDARQPRKTCAGPTGPSLAGAARNSLPQRGWETIDLTFNADTRGLTIEDFSISDGTSNPPRVTRLQPKGPVVTLALDCGVRSGEWTTITHMASGTGTRVGCLPGDVSNDGAVNANDMLLLMYSSAAGGGRSAMPEVADPLPAYRVDIDRDGAVGVTDVLRLIELLNHPDAYRAALTERKE